MTSKSTAPISEGGHGRTSTIAAEGLPKRPTGEFYAALGWPESRDWQQEEPLQEEKWGAVSDIPILQTLLTEADRQRENPLLRCTEQSGDDKGTSTSKESLHRHEEDTSIFRSSQLYSSSARRREYRPYYSSTAVHLHNRHLQNERAEAEDSGSDIAKGQPVHHQRPKKAGKDKEGVEGEAATGTFQSMARSVRDKEDDEGLQTPPSSSVLDEGDDPSLEEVRLDTLESLKSNKNQPVRRRRIRLEHRLKPLEEKLMAAEARHRSLQRRLALNSCPTEEPERPICTDISLERIRTLRLFQLMEVMRNVNEGRYHEGLSIYHENCLVVQTEMPRIRGSTDHFCIEYEYRGASGVVEHLLNYQRTYAYSRWDDTKRGIKVLDPRADRTIVYGVLEASPRGTEGELMPRITIPMVTIFVFSSENRISHVRALFKTPEAPAAGIQVPLAGGMFDLLG